MERTLETDLLLLRPVGPGDWRAVHAYASDAAVMCNIPGDALSEDRARALAAKNGDDEAKVAADLKAEGHLVGHLPFHPCYHSWGYAAEAAALLHHGFEALGLDRVVATC